MFLLSRLRMTGSIRIAEVSRELNVSSMTIRRDIVELEDQGLVRRVHGGAVAASALLAEPLFSVKLRIALLRRLSNLFTRAM